MQAQSCEAEEISDLKR